ncbi:MAG: hypothetical protein AAGF92_16845 [Myxococcota bacterium]
MTRQSSGEETRSEEFAEGSFTRDTLIHSLGTLTVSLLEGAFMDDDIGTAYRSWMDRCQEDPSQADSGECLVTTGTREGQCMLVARGRADEFCVVLEHAAFRTFVAAGFDVKTQTLSGVCVAKFDGNVKEAIRFSRTLTREIVARSAQLSHRQGQTLSN